MLNPLSRMALIAAAAGLAVAPVAAQANTRAGDSTAVYTSSAQPGLGREAKGENISAGFAAAILATIAAVGVILIIDDEDDQSPGT